MQPQQKGGQEARGKVVAGLGLEMCRLAITMFPKESTMAIALAETAAKLGKLFQKPEQDLGQAELRGKDVVKVGRRVALDDVRHVLRFGQIGVQHALHVPRASVVRVLSEAVFDGLGRKRASLTRDEKERWVMAGVGLLDARGQARRALRPRFVTTADVASPPISKDALGTSARSVPLREVRLL